MLTIEELLPHFENKKSRIAEALDISKQAVGKWPDGVLPELQEKKIRYEILPELFKPKAAFTKLDSQSSRDCIVDQL